MSKYFLILAMLLTVSAIQAQHKLNVQLKKELDSIYLLDQHFRDFFNTPVNADSLAAIYHVPKAALFEYINTKMVETDSANMKRIEAIIKQYGYPGKTLVDTPTNEVAFFVIQHSNKIKAYLPIVEQAAKNDEIPFRLYAMMLDRKLMYEGKEQIYGTQAKGLPVKNRQTGKQDWTMFIWPVKDPQHVNHRRKEAGFDQTVEENAKRLGIEYKVITLEDVKRMQ